MLSIRLMEVLLPGSDQRFPTIVAIATCCWGIASLWAAVSTRSWAIRGGLLIVGLSLLCIIPAYEPALYFTIQSFVVIFVVGIWRAKNVGTISQFSLKTIIGLTVFVGIVLALVARMEPHSLAAFASIFISGAAAGAITILASWLAFSAERRAKRLAISVLATALCSIPVERLDGLLLAFPEWDRPPGGPYDPGWLYLLTGTMLGIALWLSLWQLSMQLDEKRTNSRLVSRSGLVLWTAILVVPCLEVYFALPDVPPIPQVVSPATNGIDDIRTAATELLVSNNAVQSPDTSPTGAIQIGLDRNQSALQMLRSGLAKPCQQRLNYDALAWEKDAWLAEKIAPSRNRYVTRLLIAEGEVARREHRIDDAIESYLDIVRLSRATAVGGSVADLLVSRAIESHANAGLAAIRDQLSVKQRDYVIDRLGRLDGKRVNEDELFERDRDWERIKLGWRALLYEALHQDQVIIALIRKSRQQVESVTRLIICEMAILNFRETHGFLPEELEDLDCPADYVRDPFAGGKLQLQYRRPSSGEFLLYSYGPDEDDDQGRPPAQARWEGDGDILLNALFPKPAAYARP